MTKGRTSCHNSLDPRLQVLRIETNEIKHNLNVDVPTIKLCTVKTSWKDKISKRGRRWGGGGRGSREKSTPYENCPKGSITISQ